MDTQILRNFLAIVQEGSMTSAAEMLHISQPTLSVQMKQLEERFGRKLFRKQGRNILLTEEGRLLRQRAEEIISMVNKTIAEFQDLHILNGGDVRIGSAETHLVSHLANTFHCLRQKYPLLHFHITSGDTEQVLDRLEKGLLDFAVLVEPPNLSRYNYIELPGKDCYGIIMLENHPLAKKEKITFNDLLGENLMSSKQSMRVDLPRWCGEKIDQLNFIGFVNLFYNAGVFVRAKLGLHITFEHLISEGNGLIFRPLSPPLENRSYIVWKKYQVFTPIAETVLAVLKETFLPKQDT